MWLQFTQISRALSQLFFLVLFEEEVEVQEVKNARVSLAGEKSKPTKLKEVSSISYARIKTDMDEFNRVLGGGVVPGVWFLLEEIQE